MAVVLPFQPIVRRATPLVQRAVAAVAPRSRRRTPWPPPARPAAARPSSAPLHLVSEAAPAAAPDLDERALARAFFPAVLLVAVLDLATKAWAVSALQGAGLVPVVPGFSLALVFNTASAGGVWLGEHTRALNFTATGILVGLMTILVPHVARVDRRSTTALALIAGGGVGNLASLGTSVRGVPDFLAIHQGRGAWVLNVADLAIFAGLLLLTGTIARIAVRISRGERKVG